MDGDRLPRIGTRRHVLTDRILHLQLALLLQLHHRHRGELLRDRAETELRARRIGDIPFGVGRAVALATIGLPLRDSRIVPLKLLAHLGPHVLVHALDNDRIGRRHGRGRHLRARARRSIAGIATIARTKTRPVIAMAEIGAR